MSETINIAAMADKVALELLGEFFWTRCGPKNHRWPCLSPDHRTASGERSKAQHPTDAAFFYDDPYSDARVFVNVDFKSYAATSFKSQALAGAIESLTMATACANISEEWKTDFGAIGKNPVVVGLLFAFNHDGFFEGDFHAMCNTGFKPPLKNSLEPGQRVFAFGPREIDYLVRVANDLQVLRSTRMLPERQYYGFYHPDLVMRESRGKAAKAATLRVLTGGTQIVRFDDPRQGGLGAGYYIYSRGKGATKLEFEYLFSLILKYQLLRDARSITICLPYADTKAAARFTAARDELRDALAGIAEVEERMSTIHFRTPRRAEFNLSEVLMGSDHA